MARRTKREIIERDAVLRALDAIVTHELGADWSVERHAQRKTELLERVDSD